MTCHPLNKPKKRVSFPRFGVITNKQQAEMLNYIVMGKTKNGLYFNNGFNSNHFDGVLSQFISNLNDMLRNSSDTIDTVTLFKNSRLPEYPAMFNNLNKGLTRPDFMKALDRDTAPTNGEKWNTRAYGNRPITDIEQITRNLTDYDMILKYDGKTWGDYLISAKTENRFFAWACEGLNDWLLTFLWQNLTYPRYQQGNNDTLVYVHISKKDNDKHIKAIASHLKKSQPQNAPFNAQGAKNA